VTEKNKITAKNETKTVKEPPPSALNMTLPAFAAERRRLQHGARSYRSTSAADVGITHVLDVEQSFQRMGEQLNLNGRTGIHCVEN